MQLAKVMNHARFANLNFTFYPQKVTKTLNIFQNKLLFIILYNYFLEFFI